MRILAGRMFLQQIEGRAVDKYINKVETNTRHC